MSALFDRIIADVTVAYESLDDPKYSFLRRNYAEQEPVRNAMRLRLEQVGFKVEETTDFECDRCWQYNVSRDDIRTQIKISLSGPYAYVFTGEANNTGMNETVLSEMEKEVQSIVREFNIEVVPWDIQDRRISIGGEKKLLYSVLFYDNE